MTRLQREASFDDDEFDAADDASTSSSPLETRKQLRAVRRMLKGTTIYFQAASPRDVVLTNAVASGCSVVHKPELADLIWIEAMPMAPDYIRQLEHQRINFFPGMKAAATKCEFARLMGRVARLYPGEFDFIPKTFALPMEQKLLDEYLAQEASRKQVFVVKPDAGCGGDGIYLSDDVKKTARHPECVVQEYITNPLTIGGLKFDLRLYVAVTSIYPLRFYLHREGLGRMAVEPYEEPNRSNFYRLNMHLTNYSLNKFSNKFVENTDALDDAHTTKRRATTAFRQLAAEYPDFDFDSVWSDITELVGKVLASITPHLLACAGDVPGATRYTSRCFQLLGFDVLLDRDFKPHLLEINHHPSLQTDAPIDFYVKERVVRPLVRMVALDARLRRRASASKQPFVVPSAEEAAEWEAQFVDSEVGWCPCDAADVDSLTNRFVAPFLPMINCFIDACGASGRKYEALTASRFVKLMRKVGLCGPGRQFSSAEADLLFIKCMQQIGSNAFGFFDLIDAMLTTIGDKVSPHTPPMSLVRLRDVTTTLTSDAA